MSRSLLRTGAATLLLLGSGCAVTGVGVGVGGDVGDGYASGYYEPYGYEYGGWGSGYYVAPWHGRDHRDQYRGPPPGARPRGAPAFRPPAPGRSMPSIPGGPHRH